MTKSSIILIFQYFEKKYLISFNVTWSTKDTEIPPNWSNINNNITRLNNNIQTNLYIQNLVLKLFLPCLNDHNSNLDRTILENDLFM